MSTDDSAEPQVAEPAMAEPQPIAEKPVRKMFVRRPARTRMPVDALARQGRVTKLAWDALGDRDAVLAFLNTHHQDLGGRPIDLALADATGLAAVETAIAAIPARDVLQEGSSENPDRGRARASVPSDPA